MSDSKQSSAPIEAEPAHHALEKGPDAGRGRSKPRRHSRDRTALVLALIAVCLSAGFAVGTYFLWNKMQQVADRQAGLGSQVDERVQPLNSSVDSLSLDIESMNRQFGSRVDEIASRLNRLAENQQGYDNRLSALATLLGRSEEGWRLAEVEYLLRIAGQRLQLQRDVETAEAAMRSADRLLRDLADPRYLKVREQIARELEALSSVPNIDRNGIALTLGAWLQRVDGLAVAGARYEPSAGGGSGGLNKTTTVTTWKEIPGLVWEALSELFLVREHDKPVAPMLPPEREYFLRENLRLQLSAARLALMRDDEEQYQAALATAQDWLGKYFSDENPDVRELLSRIEELISRDIHPDLPAVSESLSLLRQQMKLNQQQNALTEAPERPMEPTPQSESSQPQEGASEVGGQ